MYCYSRSTLNSSVSEIINMYKKKRKFGFTRISPPANTWDTLEKRWDTLARMLAPALTLDGFGYGGAYAALAA
jgi:hypothetical protein